LRVIAAAVLFLVVNIVTLQLVCKFLAGLLVGSLEILGNPTGLVRSIGNGVADMFSMPYRGLARGPGEFLHGVRRGTGSLLWHLSTGFVMKLQLVFSYGF